MARAEFKLAPSADDLWCVPSRILKLRWPARCRICGRELAAQTRASWDVETRLVTCVRCLERADGVGGSPPPAPPSGSLPTSLDSAHEAIPAPFASGHPGASAQREYRRRKNNREARVRRQHPYVGSLLLALRGSPQHERAFERGGFGEETIARSLERRLAKSRVHLLHDRRMPGGYGNIDHLAVAARGVYVIDAKAIKGKVRVVAGASSTGSKLQVNGRTRNKLVLGLARQVGAVRNELDRHGYREIPLTGVLCFTEADFPLFGRMQIDGYLLRHRRALAKELGSPGPFTEEVIDSLARDLHSWFPSA